MAVVRPAWILTQIDGAQIRMLPVELELEVLMDPVVDLPGVAQPQELRGLGLPGRSTHVPRDFEAPCRVLSLALFELTQLGQLIDHDVAVPVDCDRAALLGAESVEARDARGEHRL